MVGRSGRRSEGERSLDVESQLADRKLPHNLEAEEGVLGALLVDCESAAGVFQLLAANDFYSPRHAKVFEAFRNVYDRNSTLDEVLALAELEKEGVAESAGGMEFLAGLIQRLPTAANAEYYARIVREKAILRSLIATCGEVIQGVYDSNRSAQEQLDVAEQRVFEIGEREIGRDFVEIGQVIDEHFERLDQRQGGPEGVLTGFRDLDDMVTGFHPAELIIVAGRPSMGKTSFSLNVVEHAAMAGKCVCLFSLEVSKDQLIQNLLCSFSRVDAHRLRKRSLSNDQWHSLIEGASRLRQTKIFIDDTPGLTPLSLKAKARRLDQRHPLDLIVIDYLQLMEVGGSESRQQEISTVSRSLKALARELSVPLIAISQLSRNVENRDRDKHRPRLSDLRESGAIEQDADLVLLLYREEYYDPGKEEAKGKAEAIIAKQRHGPTGTVHLHFRNQFMRFENLDLAHHDEEAFEP
jgi:replicative DNA helicase